MCPLVQTWRVPSSSVPSVDMALDDIGSNCTLKPAYRDNSLETVKQVKLNGSSELYKVQIGIPILMQLFRGWQQLFGACTQCDSYFAGDDRNLWTIQECLLVFSRIYRRNTIYWEYQILIFIRKSGNVHAYKIPCCVLVNWGKNMNGYCRVSLRTSTAINLRLNMNKSLKAIILCCIKFLR